MGILSDLNQIYRTGDETQMRRFLCNNSFEPVGTVRQHASSVRRSTEPSFLTQRTMTEQRMLRHEFELSCSSYT